MKIETTVKSRFSHSVKYGEGIKVTFDNKGIAEVNDTDGELLIERYKGQIYEAGQVPKPGMVRSAVLTDKKISGEVAELKESLQKANGLIGSYKAQAQSAQDGEKVWRDKCTALLQEIEALKAGLGAKPVEVKAEETPKTELSAEEKAAADLAALKATLEAKTVKQLVAYAVELKLPVEEYKKLNKENLVKYLIEKTNNV